MGIIFKTFIMKEEKKSKWNLLRNLFLTEIRKKLETNEESISYQLLIIKNKFLVLNIW